MAATPSPNVVRAQARAVLSKGGTHGVVAVQGGLCPVDRSITQGPDSVPIIGCQSPLQMRMALQEASDENSAVILTPLREDEVSDDILVRLARRRLHPLNTWEVVRTLFRANTIDPRIISETPLADLLLEHAAEEFPAAAGGMVDAESVWGILLSRRLGISSATPDLVGILVWSADPGATRLWRASPPDFRRLAQSWIGGSAGEAVAAVFRCCETSPNASALAVGLALSVVHHEGAGPELDRAAGRLERYTGGAIDEPACRRWRDESMSAFARLSETSRRRVLDEAWRVVEQVDAVQHAWRSNVLPAGFEQRLARLGDSISMAVAARSDTSEELDAAFALVHAHVDAATAGRRITRVQMARRLLRWLATRPSEASRPGTLSSAATAYAASGGYVDLARATLRGGEANATLSRAFADLVDRVTSIREAENLVFADLLIGSGLTTAGVQLPAVCPVERLVETVVGPAARSRPVLMIVLDGMSWAVRHQLLEDLRPRDWLELVPAGSSLPIGVAALPSVTAVCRMSLFAGRIARGQATDEVTVFANHPALAEPSEGGPKPRLFHKASLEGVDDPSLSREVRAAIGDASQRVVGVVVNAVDDHLDKGDQIDSQWGVQHIRVLEPLLKEAADADRIVVLVSDHGHVLDRGTQNAGEGQGLRWRTDVRPASTGEVFARGPRVLGDSEGAGVVVTSSERLRYGDRKNGYHGGATPQEVLIPVALIWHGSAPPEGYEETPLSTPDWWEAAALPKQTALARPVFATATEPPPSLFEPSSDATFRPPHLTGTLPVDGLLSSPVYARQRQQAGRAAPPDSEVRRALVAIGSRGGSMTMPGLASALGWPERRVTGFVAVLQRLLNVDGFPVVDRQQSSNTVTINVDLLTAQFELRN